MFVFYFVEKVVLGTPERVIWSTRYYDPAWQVAIDLFHSGPLIVLLMGVAWWLRSPWLVACLASMALHVPADFLLHHDDAHRHLLPISNWRFVSPVSYWDPRHYGRIVSLLEAVAVALATVLLIRRHPSWGARTALGVVASAYVAYLMFAFWMWA